MEKLGIYEIAKATDAEYTGPDGLVTAVCTDTRNMPQGCLFIALSGERFDGHDYVSKALESGASCAIVMKDGDNHYNDKIMRVGDTREALLKIAHLYRSKSEVRVVAVTGSVGKTTTKEMVACVVSAAFNTLKTKENLNNEIGVSQTLLELDDSHRAAVIEMGMDGPGQIAPLSRAAAPDIGVVTNIGMSHMEALGSRENILREKLDITAGMNDGATLILCADNDMLRDVQIPRLNIVFYGIENKDAEVRARNITQFPTHTTFEILYGQSCFDVQIPCIGTHNVYNALAAFCVGLALEIPPRDCIAALRCYEPVGMRQKIIVHNQFTVVEDCYNANPDSMRAALKTLGGISCGGKRIAVLSDMLELGEAERESHIEAGNLAAKCGVDILLCTGERSKLYAEGANMAGMTDARHFENKDALFDYLKTLLGAGDVVWLKASRGMKLEEIIKRIYGEC